MNSITKTLLGSAAFCALATVPAMAGDLPNIHVFALHPGHATIVSKTRLHQGTTGHSHSCSCTIFVSTDVSASDLHTTVKLAGTYYTYYDSGSFCITSPQKTKVKLPRKKTQYAKLGTSTETYSGYCSTAPTVFYGDTYDLKKKNGEGKTDFFVSNLVGKNVHYNGGLYNISTPFDVTVHIGQ